MRPAIPVGPVACLGQDRMLFFVMTRGSPADEDEWWSSGLDCEPESVTPGLRWHCRDSYVLAPPSACGPGLAARWLRPPAGHPLPDALRLLELPRRRLRGLRVPAHSAAPGGRTPAARRCSPGPVRSLPAA